MDMLWWAVLTGSVATALLDMWTVLRRRIFAVPVPDYAMVGRWFAHMPRGRMRHASISASAPVPGEQALGWAAHYAIGAVFALLLPLLWGMDWVREPTLGSALAVGIGTVAAPLLVMQPLMGTAKRPGSPEWRIAAARSLLTHAIFGFGLYAGARLALHLGAV